MYTKCVHICTHLLVQHFEAQLLICYSNRETTMYLQLKKNRASESIMELEEGMADYLGTTASLMIGSMSPLQVIEHLSDFHDWYYRSGLAQLLFIYKLAPEKALEITGKISNASIWENGVFNQFENYINQNSF